MNIDKFKNPAGNYVNKDGYEFEDAVDFIQSGLGFCTCGNPEKNLLFIRDCLQHIKNLQDKVWTKQITYDEWNKDGEKFFTTDGAEYFIWYVFDEKRLTEHGGSVPGWLTQKGKELLEDLNKLFNKEDV